MGLIVVPEQYERRRQPQVGVRIDADAFPRAFSAIMPVAGRVFDVVTRTPNTATANGYGVKATQTGLAITTTSGVGSGYTPFSVSDAGYQFTVVFAGRIPGSPGAIANAYLVSAPLSVISGYYGTGTLLVAHGAYFRVDLPSGGVTRALVLSRDGASTSNPLIAYADGARCTVTEQSSSAATANNATWEWLGVSFDTGRQPDVDCALAAMSARVVSEQRAAELSRNAWQILA